MAQIGQIVYNIQDYNSSGGYISTSKDNLSSTVSSQEDNYDNKKIDIFNTNVVSLYSSKQFSKLGIQAPPGTRLILNGNKTILIGQNGIYELDDGIIITSLQFVRPKNYILNEELTEAAIQVGKDGLLEAEQYRTQQIEDLELNYIFGTTEYWKRYEEIQTEYNEKYQFAIAQFNNGLNGIYTLPFPGDISNEDNYQDLYNIIIDFLY